MDLIRTSSEFLAKLPRFSAQWLATSDDIAEDKQLLTSVQSGMTVMDRSQGFFSSAERDADRRDYYFDGKDFTVAAPDQKFFATFPFNGSFDALVDAVEARTETSLPLWSLLSPDLPHMLLGRVETATFLGEALLEGRPVHHVAFTGLNEDWQIWISADSNAPLPLMMVGSGKGNASSAQYRVYFKAWDIAPEFDQSKFSFVPTGDYEQISVPSASPETSGGGTSEFAAAKRISKPVEANP
jgi:hypothetical protein